MIASARPSNADLAELLSRKAENSEGILVRAFRRAARSAFLWPEQAGDLAASGRPLTELHGVGPFIAEQLRAWIEKPPLDEMKPPAIRRDFLALADARAVLTRNPEWSERLRGDLQMHTQWSDGSASILEMAQAAQERGYEYIGITDHSKGLKIAGGIDERALARQALEIAEANAAMRPHGVTVLRSIEMNLSLRAKATWIGDHWPGSTLFSALFTPHCAQRKIRPSDILQQCEIRTSKSSVILAGAFTITEWD